MITNDNNTIIFHHYSVLYVNVIIEIWSFIWLCGPHKIEMNVEGISLFFHWPYCCCMDASNPLRKNPINYTARGYLLLEYVCNQAIFTMNWTVSIQNTRPGHLCDKQLHHVYSHVIQRCEFWGVTGIIGSNIALLFTVVYILGYLKIIICCFSSFIFNTLFMTGPIYANTLVSALERTQESDNIEDKTHDCIYSTSKKRFYCCILVLNRRN